jgi:polyribonucleotide nucleotidyltransferase
VLVKVLGVEGNRIKLSRKALLREQRQKLGLPDPNAQPVDIAASGPEDRPRRQPRPEPIERQPSSNASTITIEGGDDFDDDGPDENGEEINFNRADGVPQPHGSGERRPGGGNRRRRGRGRGRGHGGGNRGNQ